MLWLHIIALYRSTKMAKKKPNRKSDPKPSKQAVSEHRLTTEENRLVWQVSTIDPDGEWGWAGIDCPYFFSNIWERMRNLETMTWGDILGRIHHTVAVRNIIKPAQKRLQELGYDDREELVSFHLTGRQRFWAMRSGNFSYLLWWDPDHAICPSHKKHT